MATVGLDCHLILDGQGYWVDPESFAMARPRVRSAQHTATAAAGTAGAGERYVDLGPGKREWRFTIVATNAMRDYAGRAVATTGQQYRDALHASYQKVNATLTFVDLLGAVWTVRFDELTEEILDVRGQADSALQYLCHVVLVEA
jgi:hypothetical protein